MISFEDFKKIELKIGKILKAEKIEGSDKLLLLEVDLGNEKRQIVAGIGKKYESSSLVGKNVVVVANLEPKKLMGYESQGMILAADRGGEPVLLVPEEEVEPGSSVH